MTACRSCGAEIFWGTTKNGKREPIDFEPVAHGNIEIVASGETEDGVTAVLVRHLLKGEAESATLFEPPPRYVSHFVTCPDAAKHRRAA